MFGHVPICTFLRNFSGFLLFRLLSVCLYKITNKLALGEIRVFLQVLNTAAV